jgi:uridine kinase
VVAIAGGSGAGKSWLAGELARRLAPRAAVLSLDRFYRDLSRLPPAERARRNFDVPTAIDWPLVVRSLRAMRAGQSPAIPRYSFSSHTRQKRWQRWRPVDVVLVEGLWPYWRRPLAGLFDLRLFKRGHAALRRQRRLARDTRERGRTPASVTDQWRRHVAPQHARYVRPQSRWAHQVLPGVVSSVGLNRLERKIRRLAG